MITVIMPSMFIPSGIIDRIKEITSHPLVQEFILIDNTNDGYEINETIPKLRHIKEKKNTFVNPAWNKGVSLAKTDKLMIVNDDIITDFNGLIDLVYHEITENRGVIGLGTGCWNGTNKNFKLSQIDRLSTGFGCLYFINKKSYLSIPDELKVWYGDNWLFEKTNKTPYQILNWPVTGVLSATVDRPEFNSIKNNDISIWNEKYKKMKNVFFPMREHQNAKDGLVSLIEYIKEYGDTKKMKMIEIGSYVGESTKMFCDNFMEVISIDPHIGDYDINDPAVSNHASFNVVYDEFIKNMEPYNNFRHIRMTSDDAIKYLIGVKVDFIYIDGLHTYEQIKKDIENYLPLISENGFIGGHDYGSNWEGVVKGVNEALPGEPDKTFVDTSWIKKL
jgi:hypothetical protein